MTKQKSVVIITSLTFNKKGNQSLKRFVEMFLQRDFHVVIYTTAKSNWSEKYESEKKLEINTIKGLSRIIHKKKRFIEQKDQNFFSKLKSEEIRPTFGAHNFTTLFKKWLLFAIFLLDNLKLTSYLILNPNKLKRAFRNNRI